MGIVRKDYNIITLPFTNSMSIGKRLFLILPEVSMANTKSMRPSHPIEVKSYNATQNNKTWCICISYFVHLHPNICDFVYYMYIV